MKGANPTIALTLVIVLTLLPACAAYQARQQVEKVLRDDQLRVHAWYAAHAELIKACTSPPTRADCAPRYVKKTPWVVEVDDWEWVAMPSYNVIVAVHEYALRTLTPDPPVYIEYTIAAARYLATKVDAGELSPEGFRVAFSKVWEWMRGQMGQHYELVALSLKKAEESDKRVWETVGSIAVGLAIVLGAAVVAAAAASAAVPPPPPPVICNVQHHSVQYGRQYPPVYTGSTIICH